MRETRNKRKIQLKNIILDNIYQNLKEYIIVTIILLVGIIAGVIFINNISESQIQEIKQYIISFIDSLKKEYSINRVNLLKNSLLENLKFTIGMWFIGSTVIGMPIVLGIVLYVVDKKAPSEVKFEDMTFKQSFLIGLSQAIAAAFPGTSRSGITMTVARALKVDRESAAKYSFLLSTPIVLAAVLVSIKDFEFTLAFFMGVLFSFLVGIIVIKFLLNYLKKGSFKGFAIYRVILGIIVITMTIMR
mgnify:CR=1 FL=1